MPDEAAGVTGNGSLASRAIGRHARLDYDHFETVFPSTMHITMQAGRRRFFMPLK
jgi:hypothetical protein